MVQGLAHHTHAFPRSLGLCSQHILLLPLRYLIKHYTRWYQAGRVRYNKHFLKIIQINKTKQNCMCTNWGRLNLLAFCVDRHPRSFIWLKVQSEAMVLYGSIFATKTNKQTKSPVRLGPLLEPQHPVQRPLKILLFPAYKLYYMWSHLLNFDRNIFKGTGKLQQAQSWAKTERGLETSSCKV